MMLPKQLPANLPLNLHPQSLPILVSVYCCRPDSSETDGQSTGYQKCVAPAFDLGHAGRSDYRYGSNAATDLCNPVACVPVQGPDPDPNPAGPDSGVLKKYRSCRLFVLLLALQVYQQ